MTYHKGVFRTLSNIRDDHRCSIIDVASDLNTHLCLQYNKFNKFKEFYVNEAAF